MVRCEPNINNANSGTIIVSETGPRDHENKYDFKIATLYVTDLKMDFN